MLVLSHRYNLTELIDGFNFWRNSSCQKAEDKSIRKAENEQADAPACSRELNLLMTQTKVD